MSSHKDELKSALSFSAIISFYGIVSMIVWFIGPSMGFGYVERIVLIALLLITWPFAILINRFRKRRQEAAETAESAERSKQPHPSGTVAPTGSYSELSRGAQEAVDWLHSTKLAATEKGSPLYSLPWFLVAGPHLSGKTALTLSSGLDFHALPSKRSSELDVIKPTRDCEWRVTDHAVFLDTAGRYQTEGPDQDEWAALIETIKKHRRDRPLDGFLIAVNGAEVVKAADAEIERQAKVLRARLDEAIARAHNKFPVYLVFTHMDEIEGFAEFFSAFSYAERGQVWGATIPLERSANAHALFDAEYDYLCDALTRCRLTRLSVPSTSAEQLLVFDFPVRFAEFRSKFGLFSSALFRPNPFSENPLMRGFYFASSSAAPSESGELAQPSESCFIDSLIKGVLLPDRNLAASFQAVHQHPNRTRIALIATAASFLAIFTIGMFVSLVFNKRLISESLDRGMRVDEISRLDAGKDPTKKDAAAARVEVESTEQLREALAELDDYNRNSPPLSYRFGLYSGEGIDPYLRAVYFDSVTQRFFKPTAAALESDLRAFASGSQQPEDLGRYYDLLKVYLMLSDPEKVEPTFISNQLADYWKKSSPSDIEMLSRQQLEFYARQAMRDDAPHLKPDDKLVSEARRKLAAYPAINRFYKRITTEIDAKVSPVTIEGALQGRGRGWLAGSYSVPGSFTITGYRDHMRNAMESAAEEISKDDWVMGSVGDSSKDVSADAGKLQSIYFRDYTTQWQKFLKGVSVKPFKNRDDAIEALRVMTATDSPLTLLMEEVARNTNLSAAPKESGFGGWFKGLFGGAKDAGTGGNAEVEKEFRPLHQFASTGGKEESSPLSQYRAAIRPVLDALENVSNDQLAQTSKLLLTGKDDIGLLKAETDVSKQLDAFKTAAASDTAAVLKQPLGNVRAMLYGGGYEQVEKSWREQLFPKARALESGFPFTDAGSASASDLSRFLNPVDGQLTAFFNDKLAASFEDVQGQWKLKEAGAFKFSDDFVNYINNGRRLRDALFPTGGKQPEVGYELTLQPIAGSDIMIEIDGNRVETRGASPQSAKFIWPARAGASGAKITVIQSGGQTAEKTFPGEWGLFKMFAAGGASRSGNGYVLSWSAGNVPVRAMLQPSSATSPFDRSLFTQLKAPPSLR